MKTDRRRPARTVVVAAQALESRTLLASTLAYDFTPGTEDERVGSFATLGDNAYFFAYARKLPGALEYPALWKTDGTPEGTELVAALPTYGPGSSQWPLPAGITASEGRLFFYAMNIGTGVEPWVSDGTAAGTRMLQNIRPGDDGSSTSALPRAFVGAGGSTFFRARSSFASDTLWVTDGTPEGTRPLPGIGPMSPSEPTDIAASGGVIYLTARAPSGGMGLWTADGSDGGTRLLRDFGPGDGATPPQVDSLTDVDGTLYFVAPAATGAGAELWRSDGTPGGTVLVKDVRPGPDSSEPSGLANVGGTLFFAADDSAATPPASQGRALWRSDGTEAGTVRVLDRAPGSTTALSPSQITGLGGVALFVGTDSEAGQELWRSDGTAAGTYRVRDFVAGPGSGLSGTTNFTRVGDRAFFVARGAAATEDLWVTDGTPDGTRPADGVDGPGGAGGAGVPTFAQSDGTALGGRYVFGAGPAAGAIDPWVSDGTPGGTRFLADVNPTPLSTRYTPQVPIPLDPDRLLVNANNNVYVVDAANNPTLLLTNLQFAGGASEEHPGQPGWAVLPNGVVVFAAYPSPMSGTSLSVYRSDGTPQGTYKLGELDLARLVGHLGAPDLVCYRDHVYFVANEVPRVGSHGAELWRTDGTREGTTLLKDIVPGGADSQWGDFPSSSPTMAVAGDRLYFRAYGDANRTRQLWQTDGTEAGTKPVTNFAGAFGEFAGVGDRLFFSGMLANQPRLLWTSDGTAEGTVPVSSAVTLTGTVIPFKGHAYFIGSQAGGPQGALFRSDGTEAGTVAVSPAGVGAIGEWAVAGDRLYVVCGNSLWTTDGTAEGTVRLPVASEPVYTTLRSLAVVGGHLYFSAYDPEHGQELWRTDGTPAGTVLVDDVFPGADSSRPEGLTAVGDTLYFIATDPAAGKELRRLDPPPAARVVARHVFYNRSSFDGNNAAANAADDGAIAPDKNALLAGADRLPGFDNVTSYDRGINGVMIDVADLPIIDALLDARDFDFGSAGTPVSVTVRAGAGEGGSDRVTLIWRDYNPLDTSPLPQAVGNGWLTVTMKANYHTGLAAPDVFSFGNLIGETGDGGGSSGWRVSALDLSAVKRALNAPAALAAATDFNRDGRTNALDLSTVKRNLNHALVLAPPVLGPTALVKKGSASALPPWPGEGLL